MSVQKQYPKCLALLGSTGSVGTQTLDCVRMHPNEFKVLALTAQNNIDLLEKQAREFSVETVGIANLEKAEEFRRRVKGKIHVEEGLEGILKICAYEEADTVLNALVGNIGLRPTLHAMKHKKNVALANKETMVSGGELVMEAARRNKVHLVPIDSEHSAIFQCLNGENKGEISKIILTCSGGPFRGKKLNELKGVTKEQALNHPTWKMGGKITIDSATLMNKGFEVVEAMWLYGVEPERIEVVVHPQSLIHSMVEFVDASIIAQLGTHDMRTPIQYALTYPRRMKCPATRLNLLEAKQFTFEKPDMETFQCLARGYEAARRKGTTATAINAVNDECVGAFLDGKIEFLDIQRTIQKVAEKNRHVTHPVLEDILNADEWARRETRKELGIELSIPVR
ncbi:MAG: 1-deoxy-D-xylulose-5-phosphate reductoisomerase [Candidatus Diapherotrites archaeon]|nr:1-deoxy-D-xylulose-5-phosphate reductoisomerase [Candidatus Diapherotrites archaeon]